jgi:spectrin alpha
VISLLGTVNAISSRRENVLERWAEFKKVTAERRARLEDAKQLQNFNRNADELEAWINAKLKVANDDAHKDHINLQVRPRTREGSSFSGGSGSQW